MLFFISYTVEPQSSKLPLSKLSMIRTLLFINAEIPKDSSSQFSAQPSNK